MIVECEVCHKYSSFDDLIEETEENDETQEAVLLCPHCRGSHITILWYERKEI